MINKDHAVFIEKGFADEFEAIGNLNLFMQCDSPNREAFSELPKGYSSRLCRRDELEIWKRVVVNEKYVDAVTDYYNKVYAAHEDLFFRRCFFICDADDTPVA